MKISDMLMEHILALELKPNSVLFVDPQVVNIEELAQIEWPPEMPEVYIIAARPLRGQTIKDAVAVMSREQAEAILRNLVESPV